MGIPGYDPFLQAGDCHFDEDAAQLALDFFPEILTHVEGPMAGDPFVLEVWEQSIVANLFGWRLPDGTRRYRTCFVYVPRKNGKTPFVAGLAVYVSFCDGEAKPQNICAASDVEQASLLFDHALGMIEGSEWLSGQGELYASKRSFMFPDRGFLKVIPGDAKGKHGKNLSFCAIDELHEQPNRKLVESLSTATISKNRTHPLMVYLTTADYFRESVCNEEYSLACKVRDGEADLPHYLPVIYEALPEDDWTDEAVWAKANPNLGVSVDTGALRRMCAEAQEQPVKENTFKRLHLNMRTEQDERLIRMDHWDACGEFFSPESLAGVMCTGGLDLSTHDDLTGFALWFWETKQVLWWHWVTEVRAELGMKRYGIPYDVWAKQGYVTITPGNGIDYSMVEATILQAAELYNIQKIGYDPAGATELCERILYDQHGLPMAEFRQGGLTINPATREFLRLIDRRELRQGGNPVAKFQAQNAVGREDNNGLVRLSKQKKNSPYKVDGLVASIMAIGTHMADPVKGPSIYETEGFRTL